MKGIADIIKLETSDGRDAVRFLVDVMQGNLGDFKPHHRIAAAKELLRRGFDSSPGHTNDEYEDHDESFDDDPGSPNYVDPNANRYGTTKTTRSTSKTTTKSNTGATDTAAGP